MFFILSVPDMTVYREHEFSSSLTDIWHTVASKLNTMLCTNIYSKVDVFSFIVHRFFRQVNELFPLK